MLMVSVSRMVRQGTMTLSGHLHLGYMHIVTVAAAVQVLGMADLNQVLWPITISAHPAILVLRGTSNCMIPHCGPLQ